MILLQITRLDNPNDNPEDMQVGTISEAAELLKAALMDLDENPDTDAMDGDVCLQVTVYKVKRGRA